MGQCCCQSKLEPHQPDHRPKVRAPRLSPSESVLRDARGSPPETDVAGQETIPLTNFSDNDLTGLLVHVGVAGQEMPLMPDTGNNCVIVQYNSHLAREENGKWTVVDPAYTIIDSNVWEPWGNPALLVSGPIQLGTRRFNLQFFMKKDPTDLFGNFGMNSVGDVWWMYLNSHGAKDYKTIDSSAKMCPMLASGWTYFQIHLIPSKTSNPSKLVLSDNDDFLGDVQMFNLMDDAVAQVHCGAYNIEMNGQTLSAKTASGMIAMIDSGGGPILCSDPAAVDLAHLNSNGHPLFKWTPAGKEIGEVKWLSGVQASFVLQESDKSSGSTFKAKIPAEAYTQLASIQHDRYLNGQNGFNLGAQLFQYHSVVFDVKRSRVGFGSLE